MVSKSLIDINKLIEDMTENNNWIYRMKLQYFDLDSKKETWRQIYEILKTRADIGDVAAIKCIYWIGYSFDYSVDSNIWKILDVKTEPIIKYLAMLPANEICDFLKREPKLVNDYVNQIVEPMKDKMAGMRKEIEDLKIQIKYMPGGIGYQEAKHEFDSLKEK